MDESICLEDESLLSPENEQVPPESPLAQLDKAPPPNTENLKGQPQLSTSSNSQSPEEESSQLEKSATEVTIDLGSQLSLDIQSEQTDNSQVELTTDTENASQSEESKKGDQPEEVTQPLADKVVFEVGADLKGESNTEEVNTPVPAAESNAKGNSAISSYFTIDTALGDDPFAAVGKATEQDKNNEQKSTEVLDTKQPKDKTVTDLEIERAVEDISNGINRLRTESVNSATQEVNVDFEEVKGSSDMKMAASTENVSRFFTDNAGGNDEEGKNFFETFTAAEGETIESGTSTKKSPPLTVDVTAHTIHSNISIPETPPIPGSASPVPSPLHQAGRRSRTTSQSSTGISPLHLAEGTRIHHDSHNSEKSIGASGSPNSATFQEGEDIFSNSLITSDVDRRRDAWIATEQTRNTLLSMATTAPGSFFPDPDQITMPGIVVEDPLGDPVKELMIRFMGEVEASKRFMLTADNVSQDEAGLKQLIKSECYRSAIDLTGKILTNHGQGPGKANNPSNHSPFSLQVWFTRIALMIKLKLYSQAESELQAFGSLDRPDLYYEYYPDIHQGRRGSMVPFSLRILHAELPQYIGKTQESLDRLYYVYAIVKKILLNLESGLAEDGSMLQLSNDSRKSSSNLWQERENRLLYSIGNCLLHTKDFSTALTVFKSLVEKETSNKGALLSGIGRIYLQMGDIKSAQNFFEKTEECNKDGANQDNMRICQVMNRGFVCLGQNKFSEAQQLFKEAVTLDPSNAVAVNNMAVCSLYQGKLKEALSTLEKMIYENPERYLQEGILFNLCTLYELESSRAIGKKQALLDLVSKHKGNGFNVACLKMT